MATALSIEELTTILETIVRRIVREELARFAKDSSSPLLLHENSPLYDDLVDIAQRHQAGQIKLYTQDEVWGESL